MNRSNIPYLTHTWSPTTGCSPVSAGCENCWAASYHRRWRKPFAPTFHPEKLDEPLRLRKPAVIGVSFMGDLFHDGIPAEALAAVFTTMVKAKSHTFLVLTKRPGRALSVIRRIAAHRNLCFGSQVLCPTWPLPNVYLGVSVEDQATADERIPILLGTPAAHRWVSIEPQIDPVNLSRWLRFRILKKTLGGGVDDTTRAISLIIQGCESGARRRPFDLAWARSVRDQCAEAACAYYLKQLPEQEGDFVRLGGGVFAKPYLDGRQHLDLPWEAKP